MQSCPAIIICRQLMLGFGGQLYCQIGLSRLPLHQHPLLFMCSHPLTHQGFAFTCTVLIVLMSPTSVNHLHLIGVILTREMEFNDQLSSDASSPVKAHHIHRPSHHHICNDVGIVCECGQLAEYVVDPDFGSMRRTVCREVYHGHDLVPRIFNFCRL